MSAGEIEIVPGSHDDALRALKTLPGLASNASGRPYIRGSLADDVLVRYDGITLIDPFHLKNFQSLISAIDPAGVERIEVFSGGFPVHYGTRSGGVIDVTAPERHSGYENRASGSLISAGVSSVGKFEKWPVEWLIAIRRSTIDLLEPVESDFGKPQFSDSLGRAGIRKNGAWTLGWLLLDDRIELGNIGDEETANATYRDEYLWLARDHGINAQLSTRATLVASSSDRHRIGMLDQPGVAAGTLDAALEFDRLEASNISIYEPQPSTTYTFGVEAATSSADYAYSRAATYDPQIAAGFDRPTSNDLEYLVEPRVFTYALHGAMRRQWSPFEAEFGLRLDGQHYNYGGDHAQISPRLNLRYDINERLRAYASAGRFTQAQHVEEWRVEEAQTVADSAQVSLHTILGLSYEATPATRWGFEAYTKRWTTVAPYFDNLLDPLSLTPDLAPDRVRIVPKNSEASGLEVSVRTQFSEQLSGLGNIQLVARGRRHRRYGLPAKLGSAPGRDRGDCVEGIPPQSVGARRLASRLAEHTFETRERWLIPAESFSTNAIRSVGVISTRSICAAVTPGRWAMASSRWWSKSRMRPTATTNVARCSRHPRTVLRCEDRSVAAGHRKYRLHLSLEKPRLTSDGRARP